MLRSELRLNAFLFVAQAAVSNHTCLIARAGLAMPSAPFGSPAWQLPALKVGRPRPGPHRPLTAPKPRADCRLWRPAPCRVDCS